MTKFIRLTLAGLMLVGGLAASLSAAPQRRSAQARDGAYSLHPDLMGYDYKNFATTAEEVICTGRCLLGGVYLGSGASTAYLWIRDTAVLGSGADSLALPAFRFDANGTVARGNQLDRAILFSNGIAIDLSSVAASERVTVLYIDLDDAR